MPFGDRWHYSDALKRYYQYVPAGSVGETVKLEPLAVPPGITDLVIAIRPWASDISGVGYSMGDLVISVDATALAGMGIEVIPRRER